MPGWGGDAAWAVPIARGQEAAQAAKSSERKDFNVTSFEAWDDATQA